MIVKFGELDSRMQLDINSLQLKSEAKRMENLSKECFESFNFCFKSGYIPADCVGDCQWKRDMCSYHFGGERGTNC